MDLKTALAESREMLDVILGRTPLGPGERARLAKETVRNFRDHYNPGFLRYRKSVTEAGDEFAVEWEGSGSVFRDLAGREYIDCLGGYGIYDLGIRHPEVVEAVLAQLHRTPMCSQELLDPLRGMLCRLLAQITPGDLQYAFIANSGTEAVEGAMKLARLATGRVGFVCAEGAFHGKTLGALSLMGRADFREPCEPLLPGVRRVPFGDAEAVEGALRAEVPAAVVLEPIQGEAGAVVPPDDYLPRVRELCDRYGCLLVADEVQTGLGRTGALWAVDHWGVVPDVLTVAKSLGGGVMPVSAIVAKPEVWQAFVHPTPFMHSTTFGGNPLACAAAIAAIHVTLRDDLPAQAAERGAFLLDALERLRRRHPTLRGVRGKGLLLAMLFPDHSTGYRVAAGLFRRGVLVAGTFTSAAAIRLEPALTIPYELLSEVVERLDDTLGAIEDGREPVPGAA